MRSSDATAPVIDVVPAAVVVTPSAGGDVRRDGGPGGGRAGAGPDVGAFRPGTPRSRTRLAHYLVVRTVGDRAVTGLLLVALAAAALTAVLVAVGPGALALLAGLVTLACFAGWRLARALWRRIGPGAVPEAARPELDGIVRAVRPRVRRELRRVGLPAHALAGPALGLRLVGSRRADTVRRLRGFDVDRVVPPHEVDRLHLLLARVAPGRT